MRKSIVLMDGVQSEIRAIDQKSALHILQQITRYAETGHGDVKALSGKMENRLRLRVGNYRVIFEDLHNEVVVHSVRARGDVYRRFS